MNHRHRRLVNFLIVAGAAFAVAGCVTTTADPVTGRYAAPIGGAPVISNETPYSRGLACLANYNTGRPAPRIAVGQILDYTGKAEADGTGRKITQGAALMAISALGKTGVRLVERFDTSVAELELKYASNKLLGGDGSADAYRKIAAGSIPGSDFYLVGGITELNFNIRSQGYEADGGGIYTQMLKANIQGKTYVMNVGLDLRLVDTKTLEVVDVISYQKQIVGREISAGVFDVLGAHIINVGAGDSALEPVQLAVRSVIERAVLEIVARLYGAGPGGCIGAGPVSDPLADPRGASRASAQPSPAQAHVRPQQSSGPPSAPAYAPIRASRDDANNAESRQEAYRWYSAGDPNSQSRLRGALR